MFKKGRLLGLYCETPVHAGSGNDLGVIDLPIQREKSTDYPVFYSSSLKGAIRASFDSKMALSHAIDNKIYEKEEIRICLRDINKDTLKKNIKLVFGDEKGDNASAISFTDARILLFPVKSAKNVFAWITCPMVLERLKRDAEIAGFKASWEVPEVSEKEAVVNENSSILYDNNKIVLEEYTCNAEQNEEIGKIAQWIIDNIFAENGFWAEKLKSDLVLLSDDEFKDFVKMSTEVVARIKIDNSTKIVESGALWYEENLPSESVLYGVVMASDVLKKSDELVKTADDVLKFFKAGLNNRLQIGGNETIGRGIVKTYLNLKEGDNE